MREIKFRAWHDQFKKFITNEELANQHWNVYKSLTNKVGEWVFQQFTGFTDKNGKEIYEGDIIGTHYTNKDGIAYYFTVEIPDVYTRAFLDRWELLGNVYQNPELIGNIYANKELLTNNK